MAGKNGKQNTTIDFKAFRKERRKKQKPIVVDFGDEKLELPPQMPATVMLDLMAFQEEEKEAGRDGDLSNMSTDMAMRIMSNLISADQLRGVAQRTNMDMDELVWLLEQLMVHYMSDMEEEQGNAIARPVTASTS